MASKQGVDGKPIFPSILMPEAEMQVAVNVFELAGACAARITFCNKPHKLIGRNFITSNHSVVGFQLVVKSILISNSEGAQFAPNITTASIKAALTFFNVEFKSIIKSASDALRSEGAQTVPTISSIEPHGPTSKLIVICNWTKISLIF